MRCTLARELVGARVPSPALTELRASFRATAA